MHGFAPSQHCCSGRDSSSALVQGDLVRCLAPALRGGPPALLENQGGGSAESQLELRHPSVMARKGGRGCVVSWGWTHQVDSASQPPNLPSHTPQEFSVICNCALGSWSSNSYPGSQIPCFSLFLCALSSITYSPRGRGWGMGLEGSWQHWPQLTKEIRGLCYHTCARTLKAESRGPVRGSACCLK